MTPVYRELTIGVLVCTGAVFAAEETEVRSSSPINAVSATAVASGPAKESIWQRGVGQGFVSAAQTFTAEVGASLGFAAFGSVEAHHLALTSLSYGHMLGGVFGEGHWYRGNWELRQELFGGAQFSPSEEWIIGLTPHLRYNFATGSRFIPFIDGGVGVTATSIGPPDLSNTFEFNLQATFGMHWFVKDNLALTFEARLLHMSCAGISHPNLGLNGLIGALGVTWFF